MAMAQSTYTISGKVVDKSNGDPLPGANIILMGTSYGNASKTDGTFKVTDIPGGTYKVRVSYVGFTSETVSVNLDHNVDLGTIALPEYEFSKEVIVSAKRAQFRKTPVAFSSIGEQKIQEAGASNQDLALAAANVPNVYATGGSGGIGDSRLTIRGFNDNYVGILINGVPVNDMENGHMYWSDWSGLANVANNIQVTMGMGSNPLSTEAVGGTVNITTSSLQADKGGQVTFGLGDYNRREVGVKYSTGLMNAKNGGKYGVTALFDRTVSNSYFQNSHFEGFTYFLTFGYTKGNNTINFTTFGTPQTHDQRTSAQTIQTWDQYGHDYNPNVGVLGSGNAERFINERVNYYFKPVFSLDDTYRLSNNSILTATVYYSYGKGYGSGPLTVYGYHMPEDANTGLLDYNQVFATNMDSPDTAYNAQGQIVTGNASQGILRESHNDHKWGGIIANFEQKITKELTMNISFDGRDYVGSHYRTVRNLLGGDFWVENTNPNQNYDNSGYGNTGLIAYYPGDKIAYYDLGYVKKYGLNAQFEYTNDRVSAFIDGSISNTGYARKDYFILNEPKTKFYNFGGYIVKGGVNYNLTPALNIFANAGYNSAAPYFNGVFRYTNTPINGAHNEKITSFEAGIGIKPNVRSSITIDLYHTRWADQTYNFSANSVAGANESNLFNVQGLNEIHKGLEVRGEVYLTNEFSVDGGLALSDNYYENDVSSAIFNNAHKKIDEANLYIKNLKVSGAPQTMASLGFNYRFNVDGKGYFFINPRMRYLADYYASFNPTNRTNPNNRIQAYKINPYSIFDITAGYNFHFKQNVAGINSGEVLLSLTNFMNANYITDAYDSNGSREQVQVYYGRPRTLNLTFKLNF